MPMFHDNPRRATPSGHWQATIVYPNISARSTDYRVSYYPSEQPTRPLATHPVVWNDRLVVVGVFRTPAEAKREVSRYVRNVP